MDVINDGGLALMISVGHRTGHLDAMDGMPPSTSEEIAREAGLEERYVREWPSALATGGIVEYVGEDRFRLPPEHAAFLTRRATPDNLAVFAQYIAILGAVEDDVVECFRDGGGVPYERYPRFHDVMAEDSAQTVLSSLEEHILPLVPDLPPASRTGPDGSTPAAATDARCSSSRRATRRAASWATTSRTSTRPPSPRRSTTRAPSTPSTTRLGTMWGRETALSCLEDAGLGDVRIHELDHDIQNDCCVARVG